MFHLLIEVLIVGLTPSGLFVSGNALLLAEVCLVTLFDVSGDTGTVSALLLLIDLQIWRQHSHGVLFV